MHEFSIKTSKKYEIIDITQKINEILKKSKIDEGVCNVFTPHATAAITINENWDPNINKDFLDLLNNLIPEGKWLHDKVDSNGAAHLKAAIIGPSETVPVKNNVLLLGKWQSIVLCEFDGPRERRIIVSALKTE